MDEPFLKLMADIDAARNAIRCSRTGAFFRGHSNATYRLIPSLLRNQIASDAEHNLYHECFARANHLIARDSSSWERLAFFQHYGIPTRLLDWTESLAVALYFAVRSRPDSPHLWIVNAFLLNKTNKVTKTPRILMAGLDAIPDYHDCFIKIDDRTEWPYRFPVFMQIPWTKERLRAQSAFFTFHPGSGSLDDDCPKYVRKVDIPLEAIPGVNQFLETAGITDHTVFPDFVGLANYLRNRYRV